MLVSGEHPVPVTSEAFSFIGGGDIVGIPVPTIIFLVLGVIFHIILIKNKLVKWIYAIGGNEQAAIVCGLNVGKAKLIIYLFRWIDSWCWICYLTCVGLGDPNSGLGHELEQL